MLDRSRARRSPSSVRVHLAVMCGAVGLIVATPGVAFAGPFGEFDAQCRKLDAEWREQIMTAKKVKETMSAAHNVFDKDKGKLVRKYKGKVVKAAKGLKKFLKAARKQYGGKGFNGKFIADQLDQMLDRLDRGWDRITKPTEKRGKRKVSKWGQGANMVPWSQMMTVRESILSAALCFYDLAEPRLFVRAEESKQIKGESL